MSANFSKTNSEKEKISGSRESNPGQQGEKRTGQASLPRVAFPDHYRRSRAQS